MASSGMHFEKISEAVNLVMERKVASKVFKISRTTINKTKKAAPKEHYGQNYGSLN